MLVFALMLLPLEEPFAAYRAATRAEVPCNRATAPGDVTVCGRREANKRYRVPLTSIPVRDQVHREREALLTDPTPTCGRRAQVTGCGMAGVTMTHGAAGTSLKPRKVRSRGYRVQESTRTAQPLLSHRFPSNPRSC